MASASTTAVEAANDVFTLNPYEGHPALSQLESDVLWEYAKLAQHVKIVRLFLSFFLPDISSL